MSATETLEKGQKRAGDEQEKPRRQKKQKLPRLPDNAKISKRPIHHPAIPTPFASSSAPKVLYIKPSSPFIPAVKRVRSLLSESCKRSSQSSQSLNKLKPNGRLNNKDIERAIAESSSAGGGTGKGRRSQTAEEEVFLKATGRAIPRALSIGNYFQGQVDCRVRVELGSVLAIDDIELEAPHSAEASGEAEDEEGDVEMIAGDEKKSKNGKGKRRGKTMAEDDVPETRIRNLSAVTVAIGLK